jgi:hypothetical protein
MLAIILPVIKITLTVNVYIYFSYFWGMATICFDETIIILIIITIIIIIIIIIVII